MKLHRVSLLLIASCVFLAPLHAGSDKRLRSQTVKENGSVRVKMMGQVPRPKAPAQAPTRGGNLTLWVAPTGNNATGDGSQTAPYQTIQFAVIQANTGDEIRVLPGTYNECINNTAFVLGERRNLRIVADDWLVNGNRTSTIIDGTGACVFPFSAVNLAGSSAGSHFEGFTVTGAAASGVFLLGSGVVTNNVITNNTSLEGGGVYVYPATCSYGPTGSFVTNNQITNNTADDEGRCDVSFTPCVDDNGCPALEVCLFRGGDGGGVFVRGDVFAQDLGSPGCQGGDGRVTVENNVIDGNGADFAFGGGVFVRANAETGHSSQVTISQNLISNNTTLFPALGYGGGIWMGTYGNGTSLIDFVNNTVTSNLSTGDGGGLSAWIDIDTVGDHTINVTANDIQSNIAEGSGGAMDLFVFGLDLQGTAGPARLNAEGNLIVNNEAQGVAPSFYPGIGGGISANIWSQRSNAIMELNILGNNILANTSTLAGGGVAAIAIADSDPADDPMTRGPALATLTAGNNLIAGNTATDVGGGGTGTTAVGGGIYAYAEGLGASSIGPSKSQVLLKFNTVAQNVSDTGSGGIEVEAYTERDTGNDSGEVNFEFDHSIIYDNTGFGIGGLEPPAAGILLNAGFAPVTNQGSCDTTICGTGVYTLMTDHNALFMNAGGDLESSWIPAGAGTIFTDPLLDSSFVPGQCSDTIDAGDTVIDAADEPPPNGPPGGAGVVNLGHTGGTSEAMRTLADATGDGYVDGVDLLRLSVAFASDPVNARWDPTVDLDRDGIISGVDLALMAANFAMVCLP